MTTRKNHRILYLTTMVIPLLLVLTRGIAAAQGITWDPTNSTYNGTAFTEIQSGIGAPSFGFPSATNPAGAGVVVNGVYAFGFATAIPGSSGPTMAETNLGSSTLVAGTELVLRFNRQETDHITMRVQ